MKGRYTSLQADVGSTEEHWPELADVDSIDGMPVVAAALHSQLPAVAAAFKQPRPDARLAYVMTDGAALPLALSDLVAQLQARDLVDATITCGHAFGGDYEAVSVYSALAVAQPHRATRTPRSSSWARASSAPRPGSGSPASRWARSSTPPSGWRRRRSRACGCRSPTRATATRASRITALTALTLATRSRVARPGPDRRRRGGDALREDLAPPASPSGTRSSTSRRSASSSSWRHTTPVVSMGRPAATIPVLFEAAAAAGRAPRRRTSAAHRSMPPCPTHPSRVERVLNLLALLLDTRVPLTREDIVREVTGYPPQTVGEPARVRARQGRCCAAWASRSRWRRSATTTEIGYRVRPDDYYLPDLGLDRRRDGRVARRGERGVARRRQSGAGRAHEARRPRRPRPPHRSRRCRSSRRSRRSSTRSATGRSSRSRTAAETRTLEPWGLSSKRGHWYVVGCDRDRDAIRAFRADRIEGDVDARRTRYLPRARRLPARRPHRGPAVDARRRRPRHRPARVDADHTDGMLDHLGADATVGDRAGRSATWSHGHEPRRVPLLRARLPRHTRK